jgi:hypothetical protein
MSWPLAALEKTMHLLDSLQGQAADILHSATPGATHEDIVGALNGRYGVHQLEESYWPQLSREATLYNNFQLAQGAPARLAEDFIQSDAARDFVYGMEDRQLKQRLNMSVDRFINEALTLQDAKTVAGPPPRLGDVRAMAPMGKRAPQDLTARMLVVWGRQIFKFTLPTVSLSGSLSCLTPRKSSAFTKTRLITKQRKK